MSKRLIPFLAALAIGLSAWGVDTTFQVVTNTTQVVEAGGGTGGTNCGVRRTTGNGGTKRFCKGERVAGEIISLRNADGTWGRTYYRCYLPDPGRRGRVTSGVIRYFTSELNGLPNCKDTLSSPSPRRETGDGEWLAFKKGDHVLGFAIEINVDPRGRTYFNCAMVKASTNGHINSGVVNPSRFEIRNMKRCYETDNWNPGFRVQSGNGDTINFYAGERILGAYILYDNGAERFSCYDRVADMDGELTSGVVNYWPGEANGLPAC